MDYKAWMRASLLAITGGGGGGGVVDRKLKERAIHGWWYNRLQEKMKKDTGQWFKGVDVCWYNRPIGAGFKQGCQFNTHPLGNWLI